jgi:DNA-binding NtrC family response regulator
MVRGSILVVDDDALFREALARYLDEQGHEVSSTEDPQSALEILEERSFDLVLTDLKMPGMDGIALIERIRQIDPDILSIVITGFGTTDRSIEALHHGAFWFIDKSYDRISSFGVLIEKALEFRRLKFSNRQLQRQLEVKYGLSNIIGDSNTMHAMLDIVRKVAPTEARILIVGESGAGKELVARAIHYNSLRAEHPFIAINCGAIPEELLESELFGHVKGAFTNAIGDREGRFSAAEGGTLFLDEIGDMSPSLQIKLLRVIQELEYEPVGSSKTQHADVRIIAATNQDLQDLIKRRLFRQDLYFRLSVVPIEVPPLRDRREDIPLLVEHFLTQQQRRYPELKGIESPALKRFINYDWPGNVRELEALIERLAILRREGWIAEEELPADVSGQTVDQPSVAIPPDGVDFEGLVDSFESDLIHQALDTTNWNKNRAAKLLNLKRTTLVEKIRSKGLTKPPGL